MQLTVAPLTRQVVPVLVIVPPPTFDEACEPPPPVTVMVEFVRTTVFVPLLRTPVASAAPALTVNVELLNVMLPSDELFKPRVAAAPVVVRATVELLIVATPKNPVVTPSSVLVSLVPVTLMVESFAVNAPRFASTPLASVPPVVVAVIVESLMTNAVLALKSMAPHALPPVLVALIVELCTTIRSEEHTSELQSQSNLVCR